MEEHQGAQDQGTAASSGTAEAGKLDKVEVDREADQGAQEQDGADKAEGQPGKAPGRAYTPCLSRPLPRTALCSGCNLLQQMHRQFPRLMVPSFHFVGGLLFAVAPIFGRNLYRLLQSPSTAASFIMNMRGTPHIMIGGSVSHCVNFANPSLDKYHIFISVHPYIIPQVLVGFMSPRVSTAGHPGMAIRAY